MKDGFLWGEVEEIRKIFLPQVAKIAVENTHNFIGNGFLVHNCGPCRMTGPIVDELATEYAGKMKVGKVNVDDNQALAGKYGVMSIPTIVIFKKGEIVKSMVGYQPKDNFKKEIDSAI